MRARDEILLQITRTSPMRKECQDSLRRVSKIEKSYY